MLIERFIKKDILKRLSAKKSKIIILYGARQTGKTTLVKSILQGINKKKLLLNGDEAKAGRIFASRDFNTIHQFVSGYDILFIDEAQKITNIGLGLKILYDRKPELKIIITGSSAFELGQSTHEPLTGRNWLYQLYTIAFSELQSYFNAYELKQQLHNRLVFGSYPEVFSLKSYKAKQEYLYTLSRDYLYKDILQVEGIKNNKKIRQLLQLLAFQAGQEVSLTELGQKLEINKKTVQRYIDLLEKFFVIFTLTGFSRNLRKEVAQKPKIYFHDLGIRNAIINNFNLLEDRNDIGLLWENFIIAERLKRNSYKKNFVGSYFWRTYTGAELDYIEEQKGRLHGYEIKWKKKAAAPASWANNYQAMYTCINQDNFLKFIS